MVKLTDPAVRHIQALYWATPDFAFKTDLKNYTERERARGALIDFIEDRTIRARQDVQYVGVLMSREELIAALKKDETLERIQQRFREIFKGLAERSAFAVFFKNIDRLLVVCEAGEPTDPFIQAVFMRGDIESQALIALAFHLAGSGLAANRIRTCPECESVFIRGERKPEDRRPQYCSNQCARSAANRWFYERQQKLKREGIKLIRRDATGKDIRIEPPPASKAAAKKRAAKTPRKKR